ncbi:flagellar basal body P-ring formation chaperone FlgA [Pacificibacter sp. AS14]|uniref:flagellar basal body P-ring formation chaperone FlgA n=1 Tax=Pacificibacter sp. AS14 TaxID=3135785 RepID=UPI00316FC625
MKTLALISAILTLVSQTALAETIVAARTIRAQTLLAPSDLNVVQGDVPGALISLSEAVGLEARVVLYSGRPIMAGDVGPAAIIERNQIVKLFYTVGTLSISADARALARAGPGDMLRVMNLTSKSTVSGIVAPDGSVYVSGLPRS